MATSCTILFALPLLILSAAQCCCGEDQGLLYHRNTTMLTAMKQVSKAMQCFSDSTQEGLRLHKHNSDMIMEIKEDIKKHSEDVQSVKGEKEALNKVVALTEEISYLKNQLYDIKENGSSHALEITRLKNQLKDNDKMLNDTKEEVQKSKKLLEKKEKTIMELQVKLEAKTMEGDECGVKMDKQKCMEWKQTFEQQHLQKIKNLVQEYMNNNNWTTLRRNLSDVLDNSSVAYTQLQSADSVFDVGYYNYAQLASVLLCSGLYVDTTSEIRKTMLHGAACGGNVQLVRFLLELGTGVDARGFINRTPLMRAARCGDYLELVQLLVQAGADTTAKDSDNKTALDLADWQEHTLVERYLELLHH